MTEVVDRNFMNVYVKIYFSFKTKRRGLFGPHVITVVRLANEQHEEISLMHEVVFQVDGNFPWAMKHVKQLQERDDQKALIVLKD